MKNVIKRHWFLTAGVMVAMAILVGVACGEDATPTSRPTSVPTATSPAPTDIPPTAVTPPTATPTVAAAPPTATSSVEAPRAIAEGTTGYGAVGYKIEEFGEPQYGGVMQVQPMFRLRSDWDPHNQFLYLSNVLGPMFNALLEFNAWTFDRFDIKGDLAVRWEKSDDEGKVWTFYLNPDAIFWDGSPVTAEDVVFSFDRMAGKTPNHPNASTEYKISIASHMDRVEAIDQTTVRFYLTDQWADFLLFMANDQLVIVPKHHYEEIDAKVAAGELSFEWKDGWKTLMGSGPFRVVAVTDQENWRYEKNPNYWKTDPDGRELPYLDGMDYHTIDDATAAQAAWETDRVWETNWQSSGNMTEGQLQALVERGKGKFIAYALPCCPNMLKMNVTKAPFDDILVRQAMMLVLDRHELNQAVQAGRGVLGGPAVPPGHPLGLTGEEILEVPGFRVPHDQDVARAKELLAEAGYPDGFKTTFQITSTAGDALRGATIQDQLKRFLNIELEVATFDRATMDAIRAEGTFDLIIQGLGVGIVTPDHYLNSFYLPDSVINSHNWEYEGPEDLPALIREQSRTIDQVQRRAIVAQIEDILLTKDTYMVMQEWRTISRLFNAEKVAGQMPTQSGYLETKAEQLWLIDQ